jgi:hypothetical protein
VPAAELLPNTAYTIVASNIFDLAGNRSAGEPFRATFETLDTLGPDIAALQLVPGAEPVAGATVLVEAALANSEPGVSVRFTQDFESIAIANSAPYRASLVLPLAGVTTVRAIASDRFGNDGAVAELRIAVRSNTAPSIQFTRVTPPTGPAPSGAEFVVEVAALDDNGIAELRVTASGLLQPVDIRTNASRVRVQGTVPEGAGPGQSIRVSAEARDASGLSSGEQLLVAAVSDGTAPEIALQPALAGEVRAGTQLVIGSAFTDNFGVTSLELTVTGAFTNLLQAAISPGATNGTNVLVLPIPNSLPSHGELVRLRLVAIDAAGNRSAPASANLRVADQVRPTVASTVPAVGSEAIDIAQTFQVIFSEPLDTNTLSPAAVDLRQKDGSAAVPFQLSIATNFTTVTVDPVEPLAINTDYVLTLAASIADLDGNTLGSNIVLEFRTADFRLAQPAHGTNVVEGQTVVLQAAASALQFSRVRYYANGSEVASPAAPHTHPFVIPSLAALGTNHLEFRAEALDAAGQVLAEASSAVTVLSGSLDSDGDGISNADEIARGTDPFKPNAAPVVIAPAVIEMAEGVRTNVAVSATDADGNLRRMEVRESVTDNELKWFDFLAFGESGGPDYLLGAGATNASATIGLQISRTNEPATIVVRAIDSDGLSSFVTIAVTVLPDLDRDGIPDRDDPDIDGDSLPNTAEASLGTDPRNPDSDGDGIADGEEVDAGADGFVTNPANANTDGDALDDGTEVALGLDPANPSDG